MATGPLLSMAALSTRVTFKPSAFAQYAASTAAPHPDIPPPSINKSVSTTSVANSFIVTPPFLLLCWELFYSHYVRLSEEQLIVYICYICLGKSLEWLY